MSAEQLVKYHTVSSVQSIIVGECPERLLSSFGPRARDQHHHDTRQAHLFIVPRMRTETGKRRLCNRGIDALNEVGLDPHAPNFRDNLKRVILGK